MPKRMLQVPLLAPLMGALALVGCGSTNYSNPTLSLTDATVMNDSARLQLAVSNPSDLDLILREIEYSLALGPLPVAEGTWTGETELPAQSQTNVTLTAPFDQPPLDPSASTIDFTGIMHFEDKTGSGNMKMTTAPFTAETQVRRRR